MAQHPHAGGLGTLLWYYQHTDSRVTISPAVEFTFNAHEDIMGSASYYTKQTGAVYEEHIYDAWGGVRWSTGHGVNDGKTLVIEPNYTGHSYDPILKIYHGEARFYDGKTRQWMASDPIKDGLNWYHYVASNPTNYFDPDGLELVLIQHGINANYDTWDDSVKAFTDAEYLDLGTITLRNYDFKTNSERESLDTQLRVILENIYDGDGEKIKQISQFSAEKVSDEIKREVNRRTQNGKKMLIRTEFSNPAGGNEKQKSELSTMIDYLTYDNEKVSLVGHSKGGLVSAYFAKFYPQKIDTLITVNTPFHLNAYAKVQWDAVNNMRRQVDGWVSLAESYRLLGGTDQETIDNFNNVIAITSAAAMATAGAVSLGHSYNFYDFAGSYDLGYNKTLNEQFNKDWNDAVKGNLLSGFDAYAIGTTLKDPQSYSQNIGKYGDLIVSSHSQLAMGYEKFTRKWITEENHLRATSNTVVIQEIISLLK